MKSWKHVNLQNPMISKSIEIHIEQHADIERSQPLKDNL